MCQFMTDNIQRDREAVEQLAVAVAKDHALAVPEGVIIFAAKVNRTIERQALIVNRVALVGLPVEIERGAQAIVCLIRRQVAGGRRALGADTPRVMWDVAREGMTFVLAGCAAGLVAAVFAARLLQSQLQAVRANDPLAYGLSLVLILIGTAVACWIPGRRATSISPLEALRAE